MFQALALLLLIGQSPNLWTHSGLGYWSFAEMTFVKQSMMLCVRNFAQNWTIWGGINRHCRFGDCRFGVSRPCQFFFGGG